MQVTEAQEKWGAMTALLSLDVVKPFYKYMGLDIDSPDKFTEVLRKAIIENRQEFEANPSQVPNLKKRVLKSISQVFSVETAEAFENWFDNDFIWYPVDRRGAYDEWASLLKQAVNQYDGWSFLGIPEYLSQTAKNKLLNEVMANANTEINELSDKVDEIPYTEWDIEMYALHHFDDYDCAPFFIGVMPVVRYRRIKKYVKWLIESLNKEELNTFIKNANQLRLDKPEMQILKKIYVPDGL
ncbi:hypothetical protein MNBD_GAMMA10-390 [hydrothermal vent metagenome]|uniref:Uncharacterized protein n=1 Tax=hydrothermal vent metagenome TaxID=652676 RepID=A0A3B0Y706_9ZZZZ